MLTAHVDSFEGALDAVPGPFSRRFGGIGRLYGEGAQERFCTARVAVVGLGGVGSWAAEALARTGLARITLIDLDHISESNTNRQIHALGDEYGKSKVEAMAARVLAIHPGAEVRAIDEFLTGENCATLLEGTEVVIDCIDNARAKAAMIAHGRDTGMTVITCGAAGGRIDPSRIRVADLALVVGDPLLSRVRHRLRKEHGYPAASTNARPAFMGCEAVYSDEPVRMPEAWKADTRSQRGTAPGGGAPGAPLACAGYGSCVTVTASFGLIAVSRALARIAPPQP